MVEMSGQEIYDNFRDGVGGEGLASGAAMVRKVAARYRDRVVEIQQLVGEMESAWQGDSADRARRGAGPLLTEHEVASHHFSVSEDLTDRQSGSFFRARNSVVPVPPAPAAVGAVVARVGAFPAGCSGAQRRCSAQRRRHELLHRREYLQR